MSEIVSKIPEYVKSFISESRKHMKDLEEIPSRLKSEGVSKIEIEYDGIGDSGYIQFITFWVKEGDKYVETHNYAKDGELRDKLEAIAYWLLETRMCGWEINEGNFGCLSWDLDTGEFTQQNNERIATIKKHSIDGLDDINDKLKRFEEKMKDESCTARDLMAIQYGLNETIDNTVEDQVNPSGVNK